jgi:hypothetical protein
MTHWPPEYTIRHSKHAKHVSLRIYSGSGLEIVIPQRKKTFDVHKFLNDHRDWVEKHAAKFKMVLHHHDDTILPDKIELPGINQTIDIIYRPIESTRCVSHRIINNKIIFYGAIQDFSTCLPVIMHWLKKQAKIYLKKMIDELSISCKLPYRKLSIRAQKTMWGSCTAKGDIQLKYKILFLPEPLARYILIHELCHTMHLNHSASFWKLVASYVSDFRVQVKLLKEADQFIPRWLL